jgi:signal transduction histidine kinase
MEGDFGISGAMRRERYPVQYAGKTVGTVNIETYGPFFYSETESAFLTSINRLLFFSAIILTIASFVVSIILSRAIARPVNKSAEAARLIAQAHSGNAGPSPLVIRIDDKYHTRELAELARSINNLAAEMEEAERRQKQLTCDIAHELRTPLTCLQGDIEAMIDGVYSPDREHLESCHEEVIRLASLVQDLNILAGLEREHGNFSNEKSVDIPCGMSKILNKTEFDLASLLRITAEQFKAASIEKGIEINLRLVKSLVYADYDRLKQVFINLLSNAIKYTDRGNITVSIEKVEKTEHGIFAEGKNSEKHKHVSVCVSDTGIGIPESDLPHIFERFYRTDKSRSRSTGGAGVGLTIAAAIVAAHGGSISVESNGQGSVFRVLL